MANSHTELSELPRAHQWILKTMSYITNHPVNEAGACYGISQMASQAILASTLPRDRTTPSPLVEFRTHLEETNALYEQCLKTENNVLLKHPEYYYSHLDYELSLLKISIDLRAFFDGIELFQQSFLYPELFALNEQPLLQEQGAVKSLPILTSQLIEKEGKGIYEFPWFSQSSTLTDLTHFFKNLRESIITSPPQHAFTFIITGQTMTDQHAICIGYDPISKSWLRKDPNYLSASALPLTEDNNAEMAGFITSIFPNNADAAKNNIRIKLSMTGLGCHTELEKINKAQEPFFNLLYTSLKKQPDTWPPLLHLAITYGSITTIKKLLENGSDVMQRYAGMTALELAAKIGRLSIFNLLLETLSAKDETEKQILLSNAFYIAVENGNLNIMNVLRTKVKKHYAIYRKSSEKLEQKIDDNTVATESMTALECAAKHGKLQIFKPLLSTLVNNENEKTILNAAANQAAINGHFEILKMLLQRGADIQQLEGAFKILVENNRWEFLTILIEQIGYKPIINDDYLLSLTKFNCPKALEFLLTYTKRNNDFAFISKLLNSAATLANLSLFDFLNQSIDNFSLPFFKRVNARLAAKGLLLLALAKNGNCTSSRFANLLISDNNILYPALFSAVENGHLHLVKVFIGQATKLNLDFNKIYDGKNLMAVAKNPAMIELIKSFVTSTPSLGLCNQVAAPADSAKEDLIQEKKTGPSAS